MTLAETAIAIPIVTLEQLLEPSCLWISVLIDPKFLGGWAQELTVVSESLLQSIPLLLIDSHLRGLGLIRCGSHWLLSDHVLVILLVFEENLVDGVIIKTRSIDHAYLLDEIRDLLHDLLFVNVLAENITPVIE